MEFQEINAGQHYLRPLRRDERIDDLPALRALDPAADAGALARHDVGWATGRHLAWAVCFLTDVEALAIVDLRVEGSTGVVTGRARPDVDGGDEALAAGSAAVGRFAENFLGLSVTMV